MHDSIKEGNEFMVFFWPIISVGILNEAEMETEELAGCFRHSRNEEKRHKAKRAAIWAMKEGGKGEDDNEFGRGL